jgi:hypothetical protein
MPLLTELDEIGCFRHNAIAIIMVSSATPSALPLSLLMMFTEGIP